MSWAEVAWFLVWPAAFGWQLAMAYVWRKRYFALKEEQEQEHEEKRQAEESSYWAQYAERVRRITKEYPN